MAKLPFIGQAVSAFTKGKKGEEQTPTQKVLTKATTAAMNAKGVAAVAPFSKYIIIVSFVLFVILVLVVAIGGLSTGIGKTISNISHPSCNAVPDKNGIFSQAESQGYTIPQEVKDKANASKVANACSGGVGYNGDTYPPTTGTVTTDYGVIDGLHPKGHNGMDIAGQCGTPIFAYAGGEVISVVKGTEAKSTAGNYVNPGGGVLIKHTDEFTSWYHHLKGSTTYVKVGDIVSAGDHIADQWSNGHSTGCHLHLEMRVNGDRVDPRKVLNDAGYNYQYMQNFTEAMLPPKPTSGNTGVVTPAAPGSAKEEAQKQLAAMGINGAAEWQCLDALWTRESGWNVAANNPSSGAYGIPQSLPGSKMASAGPDWQNNAATQIRWGLSYIKGRYETPCGAWAHSEAKNWY